MKRSVKPPPTGDNSSETEERTAARLLAPPSTLEQLAAWREKVAARLSSTPRVVPKAPRPPRKKAP